MKPWCVVQSNRKGPAKSGVQLKCLLPAEFWASRDCVFATSRPGTVRGVAYSDLVIIYLYRKSREKSRYARISAPFLTDFSTQEQIIYWPYCLYRTYWPPILLSSAWHSLGITYSHGWSRFRCGTLQHNKRPILRSLSGVSLNFHTFR